MTDSIETLVTGQEDSSQENILTIPENVENPENPFAYLERNEFSAEKYKIEVKNLPKYYGIHEFKKLINQTLQLNSSKLKQPFKNARYSFVCFHNDEEREKAIEVLNKTTWKGVQLSAMKAKPTADPLLKKRKEESENMNRKKPKLDIPMEQQLKEQTTPFYNVPYNEQLVKKQEEIKQILKNLGRQLYKNADIKTWIRTQQEKHNGLPCELLDVKFSSIIEGYRNKCEFSIGLRPDTKEKTIGFRIGCYAEGSVGVGPIDDLLHVPTAMKNAVKIFETFIKLSVHAVFNPVDQSGEFKQLTARTAKDQLMLIVGISPRDLNEEQISTLKQDLTEFFFNGPGKEAKVTSLYYQPLVKRKSNDDDCCKPVHLAGETHIYETLLGLKFRISAEAFFQINSSCAEVLYQTAMDLADIQPTSTVVDVCCGTGTIGLCCAAKCDQVLGLEIIPQAIADAKINATANNIENAEFFCGKAEDILYSVVTRARNDDVIAIIDPPRAGLHKQAITALRKVDRIKKMVFIACNPKKSCDNFVDFARPPSKTIQGVPFVPTKAVMVDMFPYTHHSELVLLLQRFDTLQPELLS